MIERRRQVECWYPVSNGLRYLQLVYRRLEYRTHRVRCKQRHHRLQPVLHPNYRHRVIATSR